MPTLSPLCSSEAARTSDAVTKRRLHLADLDIDRLKSRIWDRQQRLSLRCSKDTAEYDAIRRELAELFARLDAVGRDPIAESLERQDQFYRENPIEIYRGQDEEDRAAGGSR